MANKLTSAIHRANAKGDLVPKIFVGMMMKLGYTNVKLKDLEVRNKMYNK